MPLEVVESAASASAQLVSYPTAEMSRVEAEAGAFLFLYSFSLATCTCAFARFLSHGSELPVARPDCIVWAHRLSVSLCTCLGFGLTQAHTLLWFIIHTVQDKKTKNARAELERATAQVYTHWYCRVCVRHIRFPTRTHTHIHAHTYSYARKSITTRVASRRRQTDRNPGKNERNGW